MQMHDSASPIRVAWLVLGFGWLAFVAYLSLVPRPPGAGLIPTDVGHFIAYGWMTAWFAQLRADGRGRLAIAVCLVLYGGLIEMLQGFTQARQASFLDVAINALGVLAGLALMRTRIATALVAVERHVRKAATKQ